VAGLRPSRAVHRRSFQGAGFRPDFSLRVFTVCRGTRQCADSRGGMSKDMTRVRLKPAEVGEALAAHQLKLVADWEPAKAG